MMLETADKLNFNRQEKIKSIDHALHVLNDAAEESAHEIRGMMKKDFRKLKRLFADTGPEASEAFDELREATTESVARAKDRALQASKNVARQLDASAHRNPWAYIATASACSAVAGYLIARGLKR